MSAEPTPYAEMAAVLDNLPLLLREARRARGLSERAAAAQIGLAFSTVHRMEHRAGYHVNAAVAVLRWLDLSGVVTS